MSSLSTPILALFNTPLQRGSSPFVSKRVAVMPSGAIGIWYANQYRSTPTTFVPNAVAASPTLTGVMNGSRLSFNDTSYWSKTAVTATDRVVTGPDGNTNASTIVGIGIWFINRSITLAAGTYTMTAAVKSNTAGTQSFRLIFNGVASADLVATTSWQRFSFTQTVSAGSIQLRLEAPAAFTDQSLQVDEIQVYPGSSDLGTEPLVGHLLLGANVGDTSSIKAVYATGAIDLSSGGLGRIQFATPTTFTTVSAVALVSQVATGPVYSAVAQSLDDWQGFSLYTKYLTNSGVTFGFGGQVYPANMQAGLLLNGKGFHMLGWRFDGTKFDTFLDDLPWGQTTHSASTHAMQVIKLGQVVGGSAPYPYKIHALAIANRAWTDAEMRRAYSYLSAHATSAGITPTVANRVVCAEGDSITAPYVTDGIQSYAAIYPTNASPYAYVQIRAISGNKVSDLSARATAVDSVIRPGAGRKYILSVLVGANDYDAGGSAKDNFLTNLSTYLDARRVAGWTVALGTILPRTASGFNTWRDTQNTTLSTWVGTHCDAIFDLAAEATMGIDGNGSTTGPWSSTYYNSDGTHPKAAGQTLLEAVYRPIIDSL